MAVDLVVVIRQKGLSGLRDLTEHLLRNLNFRAWTITNYTSSSMFGYSGSNEIRIDSAVPNTEVEKYLQLFFGLTPEDSKVALANLVELGFVKKSYAATQWSPRWVDDAPWTFLVSSNLG